MNPEGSLREERKRRALAHGISALWENQRVGFGKLKNLDGLSASNGRAIREKTLSEELPPASDFFNAFLPFSTISLQ